MGLMTILKKYKQKEKEIRLLVLGFDNSGKTSIVKKFNGEDINQIHPTLGFNIYTLYHKGYTLNIWDIGGQSSLRSYWRNYFEATDGLIWVVDSSDYMRLEDSIKQLHSLLNEERLIGATLLIFANKHDLVGIEACEKIIEQIEQNTISNRHWKILPSSAVTDLNLLEGMDWLVNDISSRIFIID